MHSRLTTASAPRTGVSLAPTKVYSAFRKWTRQFYPEALRPPDDEPVDEWAEPHLALQQPD